MLSDEQIVSVQKNNCDPLGECFDCTGCCQMILKEAAQAQEQQTLREVREIIKTLAVPSPYALSPESNNKAFRRGREAFRNNLLHRLPKGEG